MFLFLKLVLAHLIADYILQFEGLYQLKVRSFLGQFLHALIHGLASLFLLFPYLNEPSIWFFAAAIVVIHLTQDLIKYAFTKKMPAHTFLYFMTDQFVHILVISAIFLLPVSREIRGFPGFPLFDELYRNNFGTLGSIFFITLTFAGSYILNAFTRSYLKDRPPLFLITSLEMAHAIVERSCVAWIVLSSISPKMLLFIPCAGILRLPWKILRDRTAFFLSLGYALFITLLFLKILQRS